MVESDKCLFYLKDHGDLELLALIIPVKVNAEVVISDRVQDSHEEQEF